MRTIICAVLLFTSVRCFAGPVIKFEKTEHDFGTQRQERNLSHVFKFVNAGTSTLMIEKISAG